MQNHYIAYYYRVYRHIIPASKIVQKKESDKNYKKKSRGSCSILQKAAFTI